MSQALYKSGRNLWRWVVLTLLSALIVMVVAFYNGYPLVTSDTGSYINHGFDFQIPADRSPFYGVYLGISSLWSSLWLTCFGQALLLAWLLLRYMRLLAAIPLSFSFYMTGVIAIVFFTGAAWVAAHIMPDVFTAILVLGIVLYLYSPPDTSKMLQVADIGVIVLAVLVHNSHYLIFLIVSFVSLFLFRKQSRHLLARCRHLVILSCTCVLFICTLNLVKGFGFTLSAGSHIFMMGKLGETGILNQYLEENCDTKPNVMCAYKEDIPSAAWEFLWLPESPLYKTGGWDSSKAAYSAILADIFTTPKYMAMFATKSFIYTFRQMTQVQIQIEPQGYQSSPWQSVSKFFPQELKEYFYSAQNLNTLKYDFTNHIHLLFLVASSIWILIFMPQLPPAVKGIYLMLGICILCNAFVTATFANVLFRLQNRVFWLIPATNLIMILRHYFIKYGLSAWGAEKQI